MGAIVAIRTTMTRPAEGIIRVRFNEGANGKIRGNREGEETLQKKIYVMYSGKKRGNWGGVFFFFL